MRAGDKKPARSTFPEIQACAGSCNGITALQRGKVQKEQMSKCNCLKTRMQDGEMSLSHHMDRTGHGRSDARSTCAHEKPKETSKLQSGAAAPVPLLCVTRAASRTSRAGASRPRSAGREQPVLWCRTKIPACKTIYH